ncbi:hypothetical protein ACFFJ4_21810 [Xanthomonas dyei]|nr:hypothetical protein [Xanthomonas dyei]
MKIIPLNDVLFVFDSWTLIVDQSLCSEMAVGDEFILLDDSKMEVGRARLKSVLPSRNFDLRAIVINVIKGPSDLKSVRFLSVHSL